jgi:DNA polymerase V
MQLIRPSSPSINLSLPYFLSRVPAGFPSPAQDYVERTLDLNELCIAHPAATYYVRATGDSMIEASIQSGDLLVVDRAIEPKHGDVVIAEVCGEFTVKELALTPSIRLLPRNPAFAPIDVSGSDELVLFGVVTFVIHALRRSGA